MEKDDFAQALELLPKWLRFLEQEEARLHKQIERLQEGKTGLRERVAQVLGRSGAASPTTSDDDTLDDKAVPDEWL